MDLVTVLMCMFIVLYAMSSVDEEKYAALSQSLAEGLGASEEEIAAAAGLIDSQNQEDDGAVDSEVDEQDEEEADPRAQALAELESLQALRARVQAALEAADQEDSAELVIDERGLTVRMVGAETFFDPNRASLSDEGFEILDTIAPVLAPSERTFEIGGHADTRNPVAPFETNWELSSARATTVLRDLVEEGGLDSGSIVAVGYGHEHPIDTERLSPNRRVDVTVLSDAPERVRELMEELHLEGIEVGGEAPAPSGPNAASGPRSGE